MQVDLAGIPIGLSRHGSSSDADRPAAIFLHGAGMNRSVWALQAPLLGSRGRMVLVPDLPGHGRSPGPPLEDIDVMADLVWRLADAQRLKVIDMIGHSMGALVALAATALHPDRVHSLALLGAAAALPVNAALLDAARSSPANAVDMIVGFGLGRRARLRGGCAPGVSLSGAARALLAREPLGVLHSDLAACNAWIGGARAAASVTCPTLVLTGVEDRMVPAKRSAALASAIQGSQALAIPAAGHVMMLEAPAAVADALAAFVEGVAPSP